MMRIVRFTILAITVLVFVWVIYNRELVSYGIAQAKGQLKIVRNAMPVEQYLSDPATPESMREKLLLVQEIRDFAFDSLGINHTDNYTTLYDQKNKDLMWVVTACEPFDLQPYEWKFPIIGTFSYKGFFEQEKAMSLKNALDLEGYDTNIRTAGGWSTLGWFKDPILSDMLKRPEGDLAELIIHELTHGTLFVKDSLEFNENLATFIGVKGAERFLEMKYGLRSEVYKAYTGSESDSRKYAAHMIRGANDLDSLYKAMNASLSIQQKKALKEEAISKIVNATDTLLLNQKERYRRYISSLNPNNAYFMSYLRYRGELEILEREFQEIYRSDIRAMLSAYKQKYPSL